MAAAMAKNKLKVLRAIHEMTQKELADKLRVSRQTVIAIENNKYNPSLDLAFKMAHLFETTIEEIFEYEADLDEQA